MTYMEQVAKMLGVEIGEEFGVCGYDFKYKLENNGLYFQWNTHWGTAAETLMDLLAGRAMIIKQPSFPSDGDAFFFVTRLGDIHSNTYANYLVLHTTLARLGNCYRTAVEITPEIRQGWVDWYAGGKTPTEVS